MHRGAIRLSGLKFPVLFLCGALLRPATGRGADPGTDRVVELPPLLVLGSRDSLVWHYGAAADLEVLSLCSDATTKDFMEEFYQLRQVLRALVPPELQVRFSVPLVHILCSDEMKDRLGQDVLTQLYRHSDPIAEPDDARPFSSRGGLAPPARPVHALPNLRLQDTDTYTIFALLDDDMAHAEFALTPDYVNFLLQRRTPPLPPWFILGTMRLYELCHVGDRDIDVAPLAWVSSDAAKAARKDPVAAAQGLLPLEDLLIAPRMVAAPPAEAEAYRRLWGAQATLFVRWCLDEKVGDRRAAFFAFVEQASHEPVTEPLFRQYFGLGFAEVRAQLGRYLPRATGQSITLRPAQPLESLALKMRKAAPVEVARIKGDWERMETAFVKPTYPELSGTYLAEAERTFHRAYDEGERDPRLLAAMGLWECAAGHDAAAEPLLTAAVQAGVIRPRAYAELARIRYLAARAKPAGTQGRLDSTQTAYILHPLLAGRQQLPPLPDAAELFAELWFHTEMTPLPGDLAALDHATLLFPRSVGLAYRTALIDAREGQWPPARRLITRGLQTAPTPAVRAEFARLLGVLPADSP